MIDNAVTCEDVLSAQVCKSLKEAAKKLKVKVELIDQLVRKYVKQGITKASEIIKKIQAKIIELATDFKCEDALSKQVSPILNPCFCISLCGMNNLKTLSWFDVKNHSFFW